MWDAAARRPWLALAFVLGLSLFSAAGIPRIDAQVDFVDTVPEHPGLEPYRDMVARLDGVRFVAVYMAHDPGHGSPSLRDPAGFDDLVIDQGDLTAFLDERFPGVFAHTLSVHEGMKAGNYMLEKLATAGNPRAEAYSIPDDPIRYQTVRDRGLDEGDFDDVLAQDGSSSILLAFFATKDNGEARILSGEVAEALEDWQSPTGVTAEHQASGLLYSSHVVDQQNRADVPFWGVLATAAVAVTLLFVVRRPSHVLIAVTSVGLSTLWTFGTIGWLGLELSFLSVFLGPVVSGVGIDHAIHVLHRVGEDRDPRAATRAITPAVTIAALTTVAGLAVLLFVPAPLFAEIGGVAAMGIAFSLVAALTFVPAVAALLPPRRSRIPEAKALARLADNVRRRPVVPMLVVLGITIGAAVIAGTQTRLESGSAENEFPQDDPVILLQQRIEDEYGAFQRAYIIVRGDLTDPAALAAMHQAGQDAEDLPLFRDASSITDILLADEATDEGALDIALAGIMGAAGQAPSDEQRLPQTPQEARDALDALFADPLWRTIAPFTITDDYSLGVVAIQVTPWESQEELTALRDALTALASDIDAALPGHAVAAGGAPMNRAAIIEDTPSHVGIATVGTSLAVGAILLLTWARRGREGLKVAALAVGMVLMAGIWLLAAIPILDGAYEALGSGNNAALNDMFLLAFAITVAVGVDDIVHLASRYWQERDAGRDKEASIEAAFVHAGRAITGTTMTTFVAFAVLAGVYFLQSKNLAILTAAGVAFAYVITLLLAPTVLAGRRTT